MSSNPKALAMARSRMKTKRESAAATPLTPTPTGAPVFGFPSKGVDDYGLDVGRLKQWAHDRQKKLLNQEETQQEVAIGQMRAVVIQIKHIVKMQSWFRGLVQQWRFREWKYEKDQFRFRYLNAWYKYYRSEKLFRRQLCYRPFTEWAIETKDSIRLAMVAKEIFKKAVDKLKLTPQAVMAFFNQQKNQSGNISITEMNKVRRLILKKLYTAWLKENQRLQICRFRAGQVLARVARRIQEKVSPKEFQMISFHLWHRYASVKNAHRRDEKDKPFVNPYIARWPRLLRILNSKRIRNKRAEEKAHKVIFARAMKAWRLSRLKERSDIDNTDLEDRSVRHFEDRLCRSVISAWDAVAKERGRNLRRREKYFRVWAEWAPQHKALRGKETITRSWLVMRKLNDHFRCWLHCTDKDMHLRLARLRKLRSQFFDKTVLTVAYILLGRYGHFFLLDTWTRWKTYTRRRRSWKTVMWKFRLAWLDCKKRAIFAAWRFLTAQMAKQRKGVTKKEFVEQKALSEGDSFLRSFDNMVHNADYLEDLRRDTALRRSGSGLYTPSYKRKVEVKSDAPAVEVTEEANEDGSEGLSDAEQNDDQEGHDDNQPLKPSDMVQTDSLVASALETDSYTAHSQLTGDSGDASSTIMGELEDQMGAPSELPRQFTKGFTFGETPQSSFNDFEAAPTTPAARLSRSITIISELKDATVMMPMKATAEAGLALFALAGSGKMKMDQLRPTPVEFAACCRAQILHPYGDLFVPHSKPLAGGTDQLCKLQELLEDMTVSTMGTLDRFAHEQYDLEKAGPTGVLAFTADEELEEALMPPDVNKAISALLRGARVRSRHVELVSRRAEDEYLPMLTLLLTECVSYPCTRVFRGDIADQVLQCTNPLACAVIGTHVSRWALANITRREQDNLTEDRALTKFVGCGFQTVVFVRIAVLLLLRNKADELEKTSAKPAAGVSLSEDEEVALVLRRRKISRLWEIEESLTQVIGLDIPPEFSKREKIDQFRDFNVLTEADHMSESKVLYVPDTDDIELKEVLGEQALLLGPLSDDAVAIRNSFLGRDDGLLTRGFMKQARKDYLDLQQTCLNDIKRRGEERRDALGIVKPLLGGEEHAVEAMTKQLANSTKGGQKNRKGKKGKNDQCIPPETPLFDEDGNVISSNDPPDGTVLMTDATEDFRTDNFVQTERPATAMTDGSSPRRPVIDEDGNMIASLVAGDHTGGEDLGSPAKSKLSDADSDEDSDVFSDVDEDLSEQRHRLQTQGGTVIGGEWGVGIETENLESTRLNKYIGLIIEAWRPKAKGVLLHSLDAPAPEGKKKKTKEISAAKQREDEKKLEKMAKHVMGQDIAKQLAKRFVDESAVCLNRFHDVLSSIGIRFPDPLKFPADIIDKTTKPFLLHKKKPSNGKKPGTANSKRNIRALGNFDISQFGSSVAPISPLSLMLGDAPPSPGVVVSVLGPDGSLLVDDKPATAATDGTANTDASGAPDDVDLPMVSEFFVDAVYNRPQLGILPKLKTWWWWPRHWWAPNRMHHVLENEIELIECEVKKCKTEANSIVRERKELSSLIAELRDFLQTARNAVLSVGSKSMYEGKVLVRQKQAKVRLVTETRARIVVLKAKLGEDTALCAKVANLIDINEVDQALIYMGTESGFSAPGEAEREKMKSHAMELLSKRQQAMQELAEIVEELTEDVKKQEKDIERFDKTSTNIKGMLKTLALNRFDTVVNVQKHLELQVDQLNAYKKREVEELKRLKKLNDSLYKVQELSNWYSQFEQDEELRERFRPAAGGKGIRKKVVVNDAGEWEEVLVDDDDSAGSVEEEYSSLLRPRKSSMLDFGNMLANSFKADRMKNTPEKSAEERQREVAELEANFKPADVSNYKPAPLDGSEAWPEWMGEMNVTKEASDESSLNSKKKKKKKKGLHRQVSIDPISGKPVIFHTGFSNVEDFRQYSSDSGSEDDDGDRRHEKNLVEVLIHNKTEGSVECKEEKKDDVDPKKKKKFEKIMCLMMAPEPPVPRSEAGTPEKPEPEPEPDADDMSEITGTNLLPFTSIAPVVENPVEPVTIDTDVGEMSSTNNTPLPNSAARRGSIKVFSRSLSTDLRKLVRSETIGEEEEFKAERDAVDAIAQEKAMLELFKSDLPMDAEKSEEETDDVFEVDDYDLDERSADRSDEISNLVNEKNKKSKRTQLSAQRLVQLEIEEERIMKEDQRALADVPMEIIREDIELEYWKVLSQIAMMNEKDEPSVVTEESSLSSVAQKELENVLPHEFAEAMERKKRIKRALKARRKSRTGRMYEAVARDKRIKDFKARMTMMNHPLVEDDVFEELADLFEGPDDLEAVMEEDWEDEESLDEEKAAASWAPEAYNKNVIIGPDGKVEDEIVGDPFPSSVSMRDANLGTVCSSTSPQKRKAVMTITGRDPFTYPATQWADKIKTNMKSPEKDFIIRVVSSNKPLSDRERSEIMSSGLSDYDDMSTGFIESTSSSRPNSASTPRNGNMGKPNVRIAVKTKPRIIGAIPEDDNASLGSDSDNSVHIGGVGQELLDQLAKSGSFGADIKCRSHSSDSESVKDNTSGCQIEGHAVEKASKNAIVPIPSASLPSFDNSESLSMAKSAPVLSVVSEIQQSTSFGPVASEPLVQERLPLQSALIAKVVAADLENPVPVLNFSQHVDPKQTVVADNFQSHDVDRNVINSRGGDRSGRLSVRFTEADGVQSRPGSRNTSSQQVPKFRPRSGPTPHPAMPGPPSEELATQIMSIDKGLVGRLRRHDTMDDSVSSSVLDAETDVSDKAGASPFEQCKGIAGATMDEQSYFAQGVDLSQYDFYSDRVPSNLNTPQLNILKPISPMPEIISKEDKKVRQEYAKELRKSPSARFKAPMAILTAASNPVISNAAAKAKAKREAGSNAHAPSLRLTESYEQLGPRSVSSRLMVATGPVRPPLYSHLDPSEMTVVSETTASDTSMKPVEDDKEAANADKFEMAVQKALDASKTGAFISVSGESLGFGVTSLDNSKKQAKRSRLLDAKPSTYSRHETDDIDDEADVAILLGGNDLMQKLMRHKDEGSNENGQKITVTDVMNGSDSYFSLADFVKLTLGNGEQVPTPTKAKRHSVILTASTIERGLPLPMIASADELSESSSVMSITSKEMHPRTELKWKRQREQREESHQKEFDDDVCEEDEDEHNRWSQINMSDEHLTALAINLKEAVLFDSQVANEQEYRETLSSKRTEHHVSTPLLSDRGQLALALRKTFQKFATGGKDENLETKVRNKKFFLEQQERETAKINYEESKLKRSRARRCREIPLNGSRSMTTQDVGGVGGSVVPRSASPVLIAGNATGPLSTSPSAALVPNASALKRRVPLVLNDQAMAEKEGYYTPAVRIYTDEMRLDLEAVKRKPYFDQDGELVIPPQSIDATLSAGIRGDGFYNNTKETRPHSPAVSTEQQRPMSPMDDIKILPPSPKLTVPKTAEVIRPNVAGAALIGMFKGDGGDGNIPLTFDLDNDFFVREGSAEAGDPESDRRKKLLNKHLKSVDGDKPSDIFRDYFVVDEGEEEVYNAYRTLLDLKASKQGATTSLKEPVIDEELVGSTYRLFQQDRGVAPDDNSTESSASLPYPYPFPSHMYDSKPPQRPEPAELGLHGQPVPLYVAPRNTKAIRQIAARDSSDRLKAGSLDKRDGTLSKPPVTDYSPVSPPPPFWEPSDTAQQPRDRSADDASSVGSELITPVGITQAVVSVSSSKRTGSAKNRPTSSQSELGFGVNKDQGVHLLDEFNNSSISSAADFEFPPRTEEDIEAEMEAELRRMLRYKETPPATVSRQSERYPLSNEGDNNSLPKISQPIKGYHSTTALSLVNPAKLEPGKKLHVRKSTGALTKLNTFARTLSETNKDAVGRDTSNASPRLTGNKMSLGLMSAGSASMSSLNRLHTNRSSLQASKSSRRI